MTSGRYSIGRFKARNVKVKKSRKPRTILRPYAYQVTNNRWHIIEFYRHVNYSEEIRLLRDVLLGLTALFGFIWFLFRLIPDPE